MITINHIDYGAMKFASEAITNDEYNYQVKIIDVTLKSNYKKTGKVVATIEFNALNPDSLKILTTSSDYPSNMRIDIIRNSLSKAFPNININKTSKALTTSIEERNNTKLNLVKQNFKGHVLAPKVINM